MVAHRVIRVQPPIPPGDVIIVPAEFSGRADMARAMAAALADFEVPSAADALSRLRQAFPLAPLNARIAALGMMMEHGRCAG